MISQKGAGVATDSVSEVREVASSKPTSKRTHGANLRPLTAITADIYKSGRQNIFAIGKLLREAKDHFPHGKWIPYLKSIEWNERTAQLYMSVADLADKYESVSHLNASPGALYELTSWTDREEEAAKWEEGARREEASTDTPEKRKEAEEDRKLAVAARKEAEEDTLLAIERLRVSIARGDNVGQQRVAISLTRMAKINPPETTELALKAASDAINQNCFGVPERMEAMQAQARAIIRANPKTDDELKAVCAQCPIPLFDPNQFGIPVVDTDDEEQDEEDGAEEETAPAPAVGLSSRQSNLVHRFNDACEGLLSLSSKPSTVFLHSDITGDDLDMLGNFLKQIAASKRKAAPDRQSGETGDDADLTIPEFLRRGAA